MAPPTSFLLASALSLAMFAGQAFAQSNDAGPAPATTVVMPAPTATVEASPQVEAPAVEAPAVEAPAVEANDQETQAEQDFDAIYGTGDQAGQYADPTLPAPAQIAGAYDPWEPFNRRMHSFNQVVDKRIAKPLAKTYVAAVPRPVRLGVSNFFANLAQPLSAINALLQGKPKQAGQAFGRFMLNATLGLGGIFDPATAARIPYRSEDFGQTLGVWGWDRSRYVELPLFGPRTVRDVFGMVGDSPLSPLRSIEQDSSRVFLQGLQLVDVRTQLLSLDSMREGATDDYSLLRDAWMQRRHYQIFGEGKKDAEQLPEYLQDDEDNPIVPIDAIPVTPMDGG